MPSKLWKNLDDYAGTPEVVADRKDEFDADVDQALQALRREYGIDDEGNHQPLAIAAADTANIADKQDLRDLLPAVSRRGFLKLTGAAAVFGLAGCWHNPPETLVPYQNQPEGSVLGKPRFYSTTVRIDGLSLPVMAKCYEHRPIKLEGNPDDPYGKGKLTLRGQAALLDLYDPDRFQKGPATAGAATDWATLDASVGESLKDGKIGLISGPIDGPASRQLIADLETAFGDRFQHAAYSAYADDVGRSAREVVGIQGEPVYNFDQAETIVALGSCPIGGGSEGLYEQVGFGVNRRLKRAGTDAQMGSLISFEPTVSQTGTSADIRQRVSMSDLGSVAWALAYKVAELTGKTSALPGFATKQAYLDAVALTKNHPGLAGAEQHNAIDFAAQRLVDAKQAGVVYVGGAVHNDQKSASLHQAAACINHVLGAVGTAVTYQTAPTAVPASLSATRALLNAAAKGEIKTLILWNANPAYGMSAGDLLKQAAAAGVRIIALSDRSDESTAFASDIAPLSHDLESWGDGESRPGMYCLQQAVVQRLWNNRSGEQSLIAFAAAAGVKSFQRDATEVEPVKAVVSRENVYSAAAVGVVEWRDYVKAVWTGAVRTQVNPAGTARSFWTAALGQGFVSVDVSAAADAGFKAGAATAPVKAATQGFELILSASRTMGDGSQANNAWLQETPDPIGKVTWDNYAAISIADAQALGVEKDDVVSVTANGQTFDVPALVQPGQAQGGVELFLGWGRAAGAVSNDGGLGQQINAFAIGAGQRWGIDAQVTKAATTYKLASTQYHHYMDGRDIVLDESIDIHRADPDGKKRAAHHHALWENGSGSINNDIAPGEDKHNISMWGQTHVYPGRRWGMLVDLNACNGCGACIVACGAENNIPVVGREEVRRGREMHWMRIDRYYSTPQPEGQVGYFAKTAERDDPIDEELHIHHQPMMCQHCGHAPCEEVCPAMATMHNDEAVNVMIYNRCIGTRFCANNCPYKVRRFNFYEYSKYRKGPDTSDPFDRVVKNLTTEGQTSSQEELGSWDAPLAMLLNPTVTVRSKGVMEKCNFCVQRTKDIREIEKGSNRAYDDTDSTLTTACAQTCPTEAIAFGDINDPFSSISQQRDANPHSYEVLDKMINTRPAVSYLKRIRNAPATEAEQHELEGHHGGHGDHGHDEHKGHDDHAGHDEHARRLVRKVTEGLA